MALAEPEILDVLVVGADPIVSSGLSAALAGLPGLHITGQSGSTPDEVDIAMLAGPPPGALLWDHGPDDALNDNPEVPILALVPDGERAMVAMSQGARGVLLRTANPHRIGAALAAVSCDLIVIDESFADELLPEPSVEQPAAEELTARELEVLNLLAEGLSNRLIARRLGVSEHTVKFHVNAILYKLTASTRTAAVVRAARLGLLRL